MTAKLPGIDLEQARWLVEKTITVGTDAGFAPLAVAVIDLTGEVLVLQRSDGARPLTSRVAVAKARTALLGLMPSGEVGGIPEPIVASLRVACQGDFVARAGGLIIARGGVVLGAIGVSGATSEQDEEAAWAALEHWREEFPAD